MGTLSSGWWNASGAGHRTQRHRTRQVRQAPTYGRSFRVVTASLAGPVWW